MSRARVSFLEALAMHTDTCNVNLELFTTTTKTTHTVYGNRPVHAWRKMENYMSVFEFSICVLLLPAQGEKAQGYCGDITCCAEDG